ncbi:hypothetical protein AnigIFM60653_001161 [Aspergillus niger]|nr:hypothetical protein AnigIFM60653_001161 [Aspergillus niger]
MTSEENRYWRNVLTIVPIVGTALATLSYVLRLYSRRFTTAGLKVEDWLMGAGLLLSYCATAFVVDSVVDDPEILGAVRRVCEDLYYRVPEAAARNSLLVNIFQCRPVQYYYNKELRGHCMSGQRQFFQTMGAISLIEDIIILCLPIPIIWGLHITFRQKFAVILLFSLGGLVCIFSLMRLIEFRTFITTDLASSSAKESIWTCLELDIAIICGCLPLMKPLIQGFLGKVRSRVSKARSHPSSGTKPCYPSSATHNNDGFRQLDDVLDSQASKNPNFIAGSSRWSSDVELQGIVVRTWIEQDVDRPHTVDSNETNHGHVWP